MINIQIDTNSEQASALIGYLKTLPFVKFVEFIPEQKQSEPEYKDPIPVIERPVLSENTGIKTNNATYSESIEKQFLSSDFKKLISLNDKFRFKKDLFNGNSEEMDLELERLNHFETFSDAWNYIYGKYQWSPDNEASGELKLLLEKRFS